MTHQIDEKLITKIKALLETRGCTEAEAQARVAKAQELLEKHGLEMANLSGHDNKRSDQKRVGGLYTWQRRLWDGVAKLNFCTYFFIRGLTKGSKYEHRLIGSHANVISTEVMAEYLQGVIESHAQAWAKEQGYGSVFVKNAIAFREGMTNRIVERLNDRRERIITEARREAEKAKAEKHSQAFADAQTGNALTILDVISSEEDFNNDYLNHWEMGTTARNRVEREAREAARMAKYRTEQAAKTPEQLAAEAEATRLWWEEETKRWGKEQKRRNKTPPKERPRKQTAEEKRRSVYGYWDGVEKGSVVGIDTQVKGQDARRIA
jgi:hypothetical protein